MTTVMLDEPLRLIELALYKIEELNGRDLPRPERGKDRGAVVAETAKELLYLEHLLDRARVLVAGQYQCTRGFNDQETTQ